MQVAKMFVNQLKEKHKIYLEVEKINYKIAKN